VGNHAPILFIGGLVEKMKAGVLLPRVSINRRITANSVIRVLTVEYEPGKIDESRLHRVLAVLFGGEKKITKKSKKQTAQ
jgi:hypothetical protein